MSELQYRDRQVGHSVANGSPLMPQFLESSRWPKVTMTRKCVPKLVTLYGPSASNSASVKKKKIYLNNHTITNTVRLNSVTKILTKT